MDHLVTMVTWDLEAMGRCPRLGREPAVAGMLARRGLNVPP